MSKAILKNVTFVELVETSNKVESAKAGTPLRQAQGAVMTFVELVETSNKVESAKAGTPFDRLRERLRQAQGAAMVRPIQTTDDAQ